MESKNGTTRLFGLNPARSAISSMTRRELEILTLVSDGLSFQFIARDLAISPATVSFHMGAARRKLGAKNNCHAVAIAYRESLLQATPSKKNHKTYNS